MLDELRGDKLSRADLADAWHVLTVEERNEGFRLLPRDEQDQLFLSLPSREQSVLLSEMSPEETRSWVRTLAPDDATDMLQEAEPELRARFLEQMDATTRAEVTALLAYKADEAGGLMNPRFVRLRAEMTADEAIRYVRKQSGHLSKMIYYAYVLDGEQRLQGVVSFRELLLAPPTRLVADVMHTNVVSLSEDESQAAVSQQFATLGFVALPVVDSQGRMRGVVTADDVVGAVQEEATRELHKFAAVESFQEPYLAVRFADMFRRRGGWLAVLFLGEMLTATAMGYYEAQISRAVVLALFIPLIISSGGNSGSQASTLVVRAMALGQVRLRDWWRVFYREVIVGCALGLLLGIIGFLRIMVWPARQTLYGEHYGMVAITIACSLIGVVMFGSLAGSMLPFVLRRLRLDPASACAPFVATLVDVTGLIIYFTIASIILRGTLL